jgi:hypothetical protein
MSYFLFTIKSDRMPFKVNKNENTGGGGGGGEEEKEESLPPPSSALTELEGFSVMLLLFCQTACCHTLEGGDRHENVRCREIQQVTAHESRHPQRTSVKVCPMFSCGVCC